MYVLFFPCYVYEKWTCDTDRWVCTDDCSIDQGECESLEACWPKDKHCSQYKQYSEWGIEWSCQSSMNWYIDDFWEFHLFWCSFLEIGADSIHDDDCIVDRITKDGEHCCDEECINLEFWKEEWCDNIKSKCNNHIMNEWYTSHHCKWPRCHTCYTPTECVHDIERYRENCNNQSDSSRFLDICTKWSTNIDIPSLFDSTIGFSWEGTWEFGDKLALCLSDSGFIFSFFTDSCLDHEAIGSRDLVDKSICDDLLLISGESFFHIFERLRLDLLYCTIDCICSSSVFYLHSSCHIDSEIELQKKWSKEWKYKQWKRYWVKCVAIFCKRKHKKMR